MRPIVLIAAVLAAAVSEQVDLTVVGPEAPLVAGLADGLRQAGFKVFGPSQFAAQLEGVAADRRSFLQRHAVISFQRSRTFRHA